MEKNKKQDFKNGYKAPTLKDIKFKDTVDLQAKERVSLLNTLISRSISQQTASPSPPPSMSSPNATSQKGINTIETADLKRRRKKLKKVEANFDAKGKRYLTTDARY